MMTQNQLKLMDEHAKRGINNYLNDFLVISVEKTTGKQTPLIGPPLQKLIEAAFPLMVCAYVDENDVCLDDVIAQCVSHMVEILPVLANDMYKEGVKYEVNKAIEKAQKP